MNKEERFGFISIFQLNEWISGIPSGISIIGGYKRFDGLKSSFCVIFPLDADKATSYLPLTLSKLLTVPVLPFSSGFALISLIITASLGLNEAPSVGNRPPFVSVGRVELLDGLELLFSFVLPVVCFCVVSRFGFG